MRKSGPNVQFLDQVSLNRLADKASLDAYLRKEKEQNNDIHYLMSPNLRESVRELVSGLEKKERDIIRMRYWKDLSLDEIGESLEMDRCAVERFLTQTLAKLRSQILQRSQKHLKKRVGLS